jgi:hypothetical protein
LFRYIHIPHGVLLREGLATTGDYVAQKKCQQECNGDWLASVIARGTACLGYKASSRRQFRMHRHCFGQPKRRKKMTKVFLIGAILALGFGPTVFAVLQVFDFIAKSISKMAFRHEIALLGDPLIGAGIGAFFVPDLGFIRYAAAVAAILAGAFIKRYGK